MDASIATVLGWIYGLNKRLAPIDTSDDGLTGYHAVTDRSGAPIEAANWTIRGPFTLTGDFPHFAVDLFVLIVLRKLVVVRAVSFIPLWQ